jgi:hypothetical protein
MVGLHGVGLEISTSVTVILDKRNAKVVKVVELLAMPSLPIFYEISWGFMREYDSNLFSFTDVRLSRTS